MELEKTLKIKREKDEEKRRRERASSNRGALDLNRSTET